MSDIWEGQLDTLSTLAEIFYRLTSAQEGADPNQPAYKDFRASRLQLRFAQDLVCCIQFFLSKEKELYDANTKLKVRNGGVQHHVTELAVAEEDRQQLGEIVRRLSFGESSSVQQDG